MMVLPIFQQQVTSNNHTQSTCQITDAATEWAALSFLCGLSESGTYPRCTVESSF